MAVAWKLNCDAGFTIVELVVVIVLLGILSVFFVPKFFNSELYANRGYFDEVVAACRYAQKLAVTSGCDVQIDLSASGYALSKRQNCDTGSPFTRALRLPGKDVDTVVPPAGVNFAPATTVIFSPLGSAIDGARSVTDYSFSVGGYALTVVGESGYLDIP